MIIFTNKDKVKLPDGSEIGITKLIPDVAEFNSNPENEAILAEAIRKHLAREAMLKAEPKPKSTAKPKAG